MQDEIPALRERGPDVGEPADSTSRSYIHPELERQVMEAIARYPGSGVNDDGTTHGIAAVAAIRVVEQWLLDPARQDGMTVSMALHWFCAALPPSGEEYPCTMPSGHDGDHQRPWPPYHRWPQSA